MVGAVDTEAYRVVAGQAAEADYHLRVLCRFLDHDEEVCKQGMARGLRKMHRLQPAGGIAMTGMEALVLGACIFALLFSLTALAYFWPAPKRKAGRATRPRSECLITTGERHD